MATTIIETRTLISNARGERLLWLETLDDGTTTINDSNMSIALTAEELANIGEVVRQWLDATGGAGDGEVTIHV